MEATAPTTKTGDGLHRPVSLASALKVLGATIVLLLGVVGWIVLFTVNGDSEVRSEVGRAEQRIERRLEKMDGKLDRLLERRSR